MTADAAPCCPTECAPSHVNGCPQCIAALPRSLLVPPAAAPAALAPALSDAAARRGHPPPPQSQQPAGTRPAGAAPAQRTSLQHTEEQVSRAGTATCVRVHIRYDMASATMLQNNLGSYRRIWGEERCTQRYGAPCSQCTTACHAFVHTLHMFTTVWSVGGFVSMHARPQPTTHQPPCAAAWRWRAAGPRPPPPSWRLSQPPPWPTRQPAAPAVPTSARAAAA